MNERKVSATDTVKVLFVCTGNICRSPTAEGVFRHLVREAGLADRIMIDSAGTSSYHTADAPDPRSARTAAARGVKLDGVARTLTRRDLREFDYILLMDDENAAAVRAMAGGDLLDNVQLLREYDAEAEDDLDVPDPYYGGSRGFEEVFDIIERSCRELLASIREEHGL